MWRIFLVLAGAAAAMGSGGQSTRYIDPAYLTGVPFGSHSHWAQPWRAYQETVPAHRFLAGQGMGLAFPDGVNPDLVCKILSKSGTRHGRIEIGWSCLDWNDRIPEGTGKRLAGYLRACRSNHIRPLVLLNGNSGAPCPVRFFERVLAAPAKSGETVVRLTDTQGLVTGRSGFSNLTDYWAAEALVTAVDGDRVTLSKPLPKDLGAAGVRVPMATLKYRPFSVPGSPDYLETVSGWQRYAAEVARFCAEALGTAGSKDRGFDLEIWNELSFGSHFLTVNRYYNPRAYDYNQDSIFGNLGKETAAYAEAHPGDFAGVRLCDGIPNTIPWPASTTEPPRVSALSRHPYAGRKEYPAARMPRAMDANLRPEPDGGWYPTYRICFPEYFATYLQTESVIRDMAPLITDIYGTRHGRLARTVNGKVSPVPMWFTEVGWAPNENGVADLEAGRQLKAKTTARYYCFFLNKGIERLYLFAACEGDKWLGIVSDRFVEYAKRDTAYPANDTSYLSPSLAVMRRINSRMAIGLDRGLVATRPLPVVSITDRHNHAVFQGDGSAAHPPLYNRDVLAWLPYQVNAHRFVVPYYVMTRDVTVPLDPEAYDLAVGGIKPGARVSAYDPILDRAVPVSLSRSTGGPAVIHLQARDYPCLLEIDEPSPGARG